MRLPNSLKTPFFGFALVGVVGFFVDAGTLAAIVPFLGAYWGRLLSFACAMTTTYALNRKYVFTEQARKVGWLRGWGKFAIANSVGAIMNLGVYSLVIFLGGHAAFVLLAGVAAGSLAGLGANYFLSSRWVFGRQT